MIRATTKSRLIADRRGMALFAAIALLAVFALLGTAYLGYMWIEFSDAGVQLHRVRARTLASGGVYAAIGEIQSSLDRSGQPQSAYDFTLTAYRNEQGGPGAYPQRVSVTIADESARVNLNTAPAALLTAMGMDPGTTEKLIAARGSGRRLASVDDVLARGIVSPQEYDALDKDNFTVYTGALPDGRLNLNSASPAVLAAALSISADEAANVAAKRPFTDWADALQKISREPATFNLDVAPFAPREQPAGVSLASRCFRIMSAAVLDMPGGDHRPVRAAVEAVVAFDTQGRYEIRFWRELRGADTRVPAEVPATSGENIGEDDSN